MPSVNTNTDVWPSPPSGIPVVPVVSANQTADRSASKLDATPATAGPRTTCSIERDTCAVWDIDFDRVDMDGALDRIADMVNRGVPSYVITANLNYVMLHHDDVDLRDVTRDAAMVVADGWPIVWRSHLTDRPLPTRVAGSEMIDRLARRAAEKAWRLYLLGGAEGVAQACGRELIRRHDGLKIVGTECPPFRALSDDESAAQEQRIRDSGADILLVAFGQPKGERWIAQHYQRLGVPVSIQLGASFDFVVGTAKRAPRWAQRIGCEWLHRMASDPRRLGPRYAANASFLLRALTGDWTSAVRRWGMHPKD